MKLLKIIKSHLPFAVLVSVLDFLFVLALTFVNVNISEKTSGIFQVISTELQKQTADFVSAPSIASLDYSTTLLQNYHQLIKYAFLLFASAFLIFIVFQGINFTLIAKKLKKPILRFFKQFVLINIFWFLILVLIVVFTVFLSTTTFTPIPLLSENLIVLISGFLTFVLAYFAFTSYGVIPKSKPIRSSIVFAIKNFKSLVPFYLLFFSIIGVLFYLMQFAFQISYFAFLAYILFIFFPIAYLIRYVYLKKVTRLIHN